jgi:hypothetical protein
MCIRSAFRAILENFTTSLNLGPDINRKIYCPHFGGVPFRIGIAILALKLGLFIGRTMGGFIHVLLVFALVRLAGRRQKTKVAGITTMIKRNSRAALDLMEVMRAALSCLSSIRG